MEITLATVAVVGLITALVQIAKGVGLANKYAPIVAILLGVLYFVYTGDAITAELVINGIATGLASMGLYSFGGKTVLKTLSGAKK